LWGKWHCVGPPQTEQGRVLLGNTSLYETPATYTELALSESGALPNVDGRLLLASPAELISFWMACPPASAKKQAKR
jgi:hypothetical protein